MGVSEEPVCSISHCSESRKTCYVPVWDQMEPARLQARPVTTTRHWVCGFTAASTRFQNSCENEWNVQKHSATETNGFVNISPRSNIFTICTCTNALLHQLREWTERPETFCQRNKQICKSFPKKQYLYYLHPPMRCSTSCENERNVQKHSANETNRFVNLYPRSNIFTICTHQRRPSCGSRRRGVRQYANRAAIFSMSSRSRIHQPWRLAGALGRCTGTSCPQASYPEGARADPVEAQSWCPGGKTCRRGRPRWAACLYATSTTRKDGRWLDCHGVMRLQWE